jgi:hypothetical protein
MNSTKNMGSNYFNQPNSPVQDKEQHQDLNPEPGVTPEGMPNLLRTPETGDKVYLVEQGIAHWVSSPEALKAVGGSFGDVRQVKRDQFKLLKIGEKITTENAEKYTLAKFVEIKPEDIKGNFAVDEQAAKESVDKDFKTYKEEEIKHEVKKDFISIIAVVDDLESLGKVKRLRELFGKLSYELVLVVNFTNLPANDPQFSFANKVIVNKLVENNPAGQGVRVAVGEYRIIFYTDLETVERILHE